MAADMQRDVPAAGDIIRRVEAAENAGDSAAIAAMMAEDVVIMTPSQPVQEGKAACVEFVRDTLGGLLEEFNRQITYVSAEVRVIGDLAFDRGSFSFTISPKNGGDTERATGKYLFLYSRGADRSWKISRAIVNLDEEDAPGEVSR